MTPSEKRIQALENSLAPSSFVLCEIARQLARANDLKEFELGFGERPAVESEDEGKHKPDTKFSAEFLKDMPA